MDFKNVGKDFILSTLYLLTSYTNVLDVVYLKYLVFNFSRSSVENQLQKFEKSLEEFYSMCDQVEISLVSS